MALSSACEEGVKRTNNRIWQYHRTVPSLYAFKLLGFTFSAKSFQYLIALMVCPHRMCTNSSLY